MKSIDWEHACTFTGHRPEKIAIPEADVIAWLDKEIQEAVDDGYTKFISGMQRGVDIWAAESVLKLRNEGRPIQLIAASTFRGMEKQWNQEWQERCRKILASADEVHYISDQAGVLRRESLDGGSGVPSVGGFYRRAWRYAENDPLCGNTWIGNQKYLAAISERRNEIC